MLSTMLSSCVLCAVAQSLMPKGPVRRVGQLICGLVLLCVVLSSVVELDLEGSARWLEEYFGGLQQSEEALEKVVKKEWKAVIEAEYEAYIVDKAKELGLSCSPRVHCREEEGVWLPESVEISGVTEPADRERLDRVLEADLAVSVVHIREAAK